MADRRKSIEARRVLGIGQQQITNVQLADAIQRLTQSKVPQHTIDLITNALAESEKLKQTLADEKQQLKRKIEHETTLAADWRKHAIDTRSQLDAAEAENRVLNQKIAMITKDMQSFVDTASRHLTPVPPPAAAAAAARPAPPPPPAFSDG